MLPGRLGSTLTDAAAMISAKIGADCSILLALAGQVGDKVHADS